MNLTRLRAATTTESESRYQDILFRLDQIFGEDLNELSGRALMHVLTNVQIDFVDGFVLNGDRVEENMMGISDAAIIVSCLCKCPDKDWEWWRLMYPGHRGERDEFRSAYDANVRRIQEHSSVRGIKWV